MGEAKTRTARMLAAHSSCVFCAGGSAATSIEHCPPRALFDGKHAPEGFEFPACARCNGGTSDEDLLVAFLSYMSPSPQSPTPESRVVGLMRAVHRQAPQVLASMFPLSPTEARQAARDLGMKPQPGQTHQDLPLAKIPPELHEAVKVFARKLLKATYWKETGHIFPASGGLLLHWFTNADLARNGGKVPALEAFGSLQYREPRLTRNGIDLSPQFGLRLSVDDEGTLFLVQATFRRAFGFVCIGFVTNGRAEELLARTQEATGRKDGAFALL